MVASSLFFHLDPCRQSIIYLRNTTWLCKANSLVGFCGATRDALKVSPSAACLSSPTSPIQANVRSDPNETETILCLLCLSGLSRSAPVLRHQVNQLKGSLDAPVKEDCIHGAIKIQAKHRSKPGLSHPGSRAVPQPAALCALTYESLLSYIFLCIYAHVCIHI